ncbi:MAG: exodeoxyribonuclease VII large subunit [Lachnospiraceae bacterium]|nr:exodeoxyribonuclease VII large subunit [Lachnospiraceae bacterium]
MNYDFDNRDLFASEFASKFDAERKPRRVGISVSTLANRCKQAVGSASDLQGQWVVAELTEVRSSGGHVYVELAEKDESGAIVAKVRGNMWRQVCARMSATYGGEVMRRIMKTGSEVMVYGSMAFSPLYSIAFNITDIDPTYQRDTSQLQAQILAKLTQEGILESNKRLTMCEVPQRIAVISAEGAAGYGDFMNQLLLNPYRLRFYPTLFGATMQGVNVSPTVRAALDAVEQRLDEFDCVVIIRGGGATTDLVGFDELQLARAVALFPLPVIVGIGHERDNTVLDFIAHTRVKTPTAAAEFLITRGANVLARVTDLVKAIGAYAQKMVHGERRQLEFYEDKIPTLARTRAESARSRLNELTAALPLLVQNRLVKANSMLDSAMRAVEAGAQRRLTAENMRLDNAHRVIERDLQVILSREKTRLEALTDKVKLLSPENVLSRGYSITLLNDKAVRSAEDVQEGAELVVKLYNGEINTKRI